MKYLKTFESDEDDLLKSLKDLSHNMGRMKSYAQHKNRERLHKGYQTRNGQDMSKISDEFQPYFTELIDDYGWTFHMDPEPNFYTKMYLKKCIKKEGIEQEFENILDRMTETRDRLSDEGFDSKFIIYLNGKAQQIKNPDSYRVPLYKFTGLGDSNYSSYIESKNLSTDEYLFAKIDFVII
jgi:hypothetical protein